MDNPAGADDAQGDLDAALLAHDANRAAYIYRRLAIRRRMAVATFLVLLVGGVALIIAGLSSDAVAARIMQLSSVIGTFAVTLGGIIAAYWGVGSFDTRTMGGGYGSGYGSGYNSFSSVTTRTRVASAAVTPTQPSSRAD